MSEIIAHPTNENLRIRVTYEDGPAKPYNDGGFPIWRIEHGNYGGRAVQETDITSYVTPLGLEPGITGMLERDETRDKDLLDRYLRIFWGATFTQWWYSGSYWYLTADPADWREHVGVTDEITKRPDYADDPFHEWEAWVEGDVHLAWPERKIFVRSQHQTWDLSAGEIVDETEPHEDADDHEEWVDTDEGPVGGFYGDLDEDMRVNMLWQFGWPSHACKHCGEGIVNDVNHGWVIDGPPFEDRGRFTHCAMGVMMHVRGPLHEPKENR